MTPVACCGYECGGIDHVTLSGTASIDTTTKRNGARALRVNPSASTGQASHTSPSASVIVVRGYIRFATLPNADTALMFIAGGTNAGAAFKQSDSKIYPYANGVFGSTGVSVTTGQWYRLDIKINITNNPWTIDVSVDGTTTTQLTHTAAGTAISNFNCGAASSVTADIYFDDFVISNTTGDYPIGPGKVENFVPTADGTHNVAGTNDFERSLTGTDIDNTTTTAYQLVDDIPLDAGTPTDFINLIAPVNATDYVEVIFGPAPGISTPTVAPRGVEVITVSAAFGTGTNNLRLGLNDNGTIDDVRNATVGSTTCIYNRKHYVDPPSAASAWTVVSGNGNFNNVRMRCYSSDANPDPYFVGVMIEAEFATTDNTIVDKTITGKARIQVAVDQTITGKSRIRVTVDQTTTGKSRIQTTVDAVTTGKARIQNTVDAVQTGKANIRATTDQVQTGKARIQVVVDQTISGKASIITPVAQTITGVARITVVTDRTISGVARIRNTVDANITGKARIQAVVDATVTGKARITAVTAQTQLGKARITAITDRAQTGKAQIRVTTAQTISGVSRIQKTVDAVITGVSRITAAVDRTQTGKARIQVTTDATISGAARIMQTVDATITGKANIRTTSDVTITGVSRIQLTVDQNITGVSRIQKTTDVTQLGKARIHATSSATITGKASIIVSGTTQVTITGVSRIRVTNSATITGTSRIQTTADKIQTGKSRIQSTSDAVITGVARIRMVVAATISGKARIQLVVMVNQQGRARIQRTVAVTQTGKARIAGGAVIPDIKVNMDGSLNAEFKRNSTFTQIVKL